MKKTIIFILSLALGIISAEAQSYYEKLLSAKSGEIVGQNLAKFINESPDSTKISKELVLKGANAVLISPETDPLYYSGIEYGANIASQLLTLEVDTEVFLNPFKDALFSEQTYDVEIVKTQLREYIANVDAENTATGVDPLRNLMFVAQLAESTGQIYNAEFKKEGKTKDEKQLFFNGVEYALLPEFFKSDIILGMLGSSTMWIGIQKINAENDITLDKTDFINAIKVGLYSKELNIKGLNSDIYEIFNTIENEKITKSPVYIENSEKGKAYISKLLNEGYSQTPSGLTYKIINQGNGNKFAPSDVIKLKYTGKHIDGKIFDSTNEGTANLAPNQVVAGFGEALEMMSPGAKFIVVFPGKLGYGDSGTGPIGPNETLVFEIETIELAY